MEERNIMWGQQRLRELYQYVMEYGKKWHFICETFYHGRIHAEALSYQYKIADQIFTTMMQTCWAEIRGERDPD